MKIIYTIILALFAVFSLKAQTYPSGTIRLTKVKRFAFDTLQNAWINTEDNKYLHASVTFAKKTLTFSDSGTVSYNIVSKKIDNSYDMRMFVYNLKDQQGFIHRSTVVYLKEGNKWHAEVSITSTYYSGEKHLREDSYQSAVIPTPAKHLLAKKVG